SRAPPARRVRPLLGARPPLHGIPRPRHLRGRHVAPGLPQGNNAFRPGMLAPQSRLEGYNCPDRVPEQASVPRMRTLPPLPELSDAIVANLLKQFAQSSQLGANAAFIEDLYEQYLVDPDSVGDKWKAWFDGFQGREAGDVPHSVVMDAVARAGREAKAGVVVASGGGGDVDAQRKQGSVLKLITAYRSRGHLQADTDPLAMAEKIDAPDLELPFHGLSDADLDSEFATGPAAGGTSTFGGAPRMRLRDLFALLRATYAGPIGAEFMHIPQADQRRWMYERMEKAGGRYSLTADEQRRI